MINNEWIFHDSYIIHVPCNKKAFRFYGTEGKIWCNKCSARFPDELEELADFIYDKIEIQPFEFYGWTSYFYLSTSFNYNWDNFYIVFK